MDTLGARAERGVIPDSSRQSAPESQTITELNKGGVIRLDLSFI